MILFGPQWIIVGETGIGHTGLDSTPGFQLQKFPWFNAYCGDIDLTGGKKPQSVLPRCGMGTKQDGDARAYADS